MKEIMRVQKPPKYTAQYRANCMQGSPHPLQIETEDYVKVEIARLSSPPDSYMPGEIHSAIEAGSIDSNMIRSVTERPEVEWAIDQSFDGLYVFKQHDPAAFNQLYTFAVYLKSELATFWKLKYGNM